MFESIVTPDPSTTVSRRPDRLAAKYVELALFQALSRSHSSFRRATASASAKRHAIRLIRKEIVPSFHPEETFEVWHHFSHLNSNLCSGNMPPGRAPSLKALAHKICKALRHNSLEQCGTLEQREREAFTDYRDMRFLRHCLTSRKHPHILVDIAPRTAGHEAVHRSEEKLLNKHIGLLRDLLYTKLLQGDIDRARRIFGLLIRMPVDLRLLWPVGIEILWRQDESSRDERFFEWLESFVTVPNLTQVPMPGVPRQISAPPWRSGSRVAVPLYMSSALSNLFAKQKYQQLASKLDEIMLTPPYNTAGELYFLRASCYLHEACVAVDLYARDPTLSRAHTADSVRTLGEEIKKCCAQCDAYHFDYSRLHLHDSLQKLASVVDLELSDESDDERASHQSPPPLPPAPHVDLSVSEGSVLSLPVPVPRATPPQALQPQDESDADIYFTGDEQLPTSEKSSPAPEMDFDFEF